MDPMEENMLENESSGMLEPASMDRAETLYPPISQRIKVRAIDCLLVLALTLIHSHMSRVDRVFEAKLM